MVTLFETFFREHAMYFAKERIFWGTTTDDSTGDPMLQSRDSSLT